MLSDPTTVTCETPRSLRDVHVLDQARSELQALPYGCLRRVRCRVCCEQLFLTGTVSTFYLKQLAQERLLKSLGTSISIRNELQVVTN